MNKDTKSKVLEALGNLVPEQDRAKIEAVVEEYLKETTEKLEAEYNANLDEAYKTVAAEKANDEKVAYQGYNEALEIITDFKNRLESQREEFEAQLDESYSQSREMVLAERKAKEELEVELWKRYENKVNEEAEALTDKIDKYLEFHEAELREMIKTEVLSDPYMLEHKLAWDKVLTLASDWLSDEDYSSASNKKIDELKRQVNESANRNQMLEAKVNKLALERDKLHEQVRAKEAVITETTENGRQESKKTVQGKGVLEFANDRKEVVVLKEATETREPSNRLNESNSALEEQWRALAFGPKE